MPTLRFLSMTALCLGILTGCGLPPRATTNPTQALAPDVARDTPLGRAITPLAAGHPGKSGIHALADAHDAFAARMMLARTAQRSLDVQYYIWHDDMTGTMLMEALHAAADRGVRVRLLLDDNGTSGLDTVLAAMDAHPNIEVRLYNPFAVRWPKAIGYLTDFRRLNRRMHNKSFTADNQATIVGGRNIGDEYFGAAEGVLFSDLDVLAVGPVVQDVSSDFDRYWASQSAYPVAGLLKPAGPDQLAALARR
ncbi:phospholipase D-like domain-containing protein, partial [Achromobacter xylosoxidans]